MTPINGRISSASNRRAPRADALRNRAQLLNAARDVFVELGPDAPLDEVARRARVGIATLYRRFPDRAALQRAVALDVLARAAEIARRAEVEASDPVAALRRCMHAALDLRISAVMPALLGHISFEDDEMSEARRQAVEPMLRIIAAGQATGRLRSDIAFGDIGTLLVRLSTPLPGPIPPDVDFSLSHRHVDLLLAALRTTPGATPAELPGPELTLADLQRLGAEQRSVLKTVP